MLRHLAQARLIVPAMRPLTVTQSEPQADLRSLLRGFSLEVSARDTRAIDQAADLLPAGTEVYLNWIPGDTHHRTIAAAAKLRQAGLTPVPHVAARFLSGFTQLADFVARLAGEAEVRRALTIGGDRDKPAGAFDSSEQVLATGLFARHGFQRIGIAGYPEGNPRITPAAIQAALAAKLGHLRQQGIAPYIATQFCFEARPILAWLQSLHAGGIDVPVRVGLTGPASITTLMKFGLRCGVGNSLRALALRGPAIAHLLNEAGPDAIVRELATASTCDPSLGIAGIHLFSFGGLQRTAEWAQSF
jgi:methylenetetrahydrofolate reductase (NADPH)